MSGPPRDDGADDDLQPRKGKVGAQTFSEFDCPDCEANNPWPDGFRQRDEVRCHYCASAFLVSVSDEGALKLKPA